MMGSLWAAAVLLTLSLAGGALLAACQAANTPPPADQPTPAGTRSPASPAEASPTAEGTATPAPAGSPQRPGSPVAASPDGDPLGALTWTPVADVPFGVADSISAVVAATSPAMAGQLFAVGNTADEERAAAWRSTDGQSWQPIELPAADLTTAYAATDGPAGLVIVGASFGGEDAAPAVWHSSDGATWQAVAATELGAGEMTAVAAGPGGYVALGEDFLSGTLSAWASTDGRSWSAAQPPSGIEPGAAISGLAAIGDRFMAYGTSSDSFAAIWVSSDGTNWQPVDLPDQGGEAIDEIAVAQSLIVAVGRGGDVTTDAFVWISSDGEAWQPVAEHGIDGEIYGLAAWRGGFVAVGETQTSEAEFGAAAWTSADGRAWQPSPDNGSFTQGRMTDVVAAADALIAVGQRTAGGGDPIYDDVVPAVWIGREE